MAKLILESGSPYIPHPGIVEIDPSRLFWQAHVRLTHARIHAHGLSVVWGSYLQREAANFTGLKTDPRNGGKYLPGVVEVSYDVACVLGDTIRNLRTTLDYTVSAMARKVKMSDKGTIFPFAKERKAIEASFAAAKEPAGQKKGFRAGNLYELSRHYPDLEDIILNRIQPYSAEHGAAPLGDMLWRVITSDNIDKHRIVIPTATVSIHHLPLFITNNISITGQGQFIGDALRFPPHSELEQDARATVTLLFVEPATLAGKEVFSTLVRACDYVSDVISIFEAAFDSRPA